MGGRVVRLSFELLPLGSWPPSTREYNAGNHLISGHLGEHKKSGQPPWAIKLRFNTLSILR